jgi:hypothetical protein
MTKARRVTVSQWQRALRKLHNYAVEHDKDLQHNAEDKLVGYFASHGGVAGLCDPTLLVEEVTAPANKGSSESAPTSSVEQTLKPTTYHLVEKVTQQPDRIGVADLSIGVPVDKDGLLVLLARRRTDAQYDILLSSANPDLIESVAKAAVGVNLAGMPPNLRAITEIIKTQMFPTLGLPPDLKKRAEWLNTEYPDLSNLRESDLPGWAGKGRGRRLPREKILLLRGPQQALLSWSGAGASTVTRCVFKHPLIRADDVAHLDPSDRAKLERLIECNQIGLVNSEPSNGLDPGRDADGAYELRLTGPGLSDTLHFRRASAADLAGLSPADFNRQVFTPDWSVTLNTSWFGNLREVWADKWFAGPGKYNHIGRPANSKLSLAVNTDSFCIEQTEGHTEKFAFPSGVTAITGEHRTTFSSKDLGPVLSNLVDAPVTGGITMAGNHYALVFRYTTAVGDFEIAVPTITAKAASKDAATPFTRDLPAGQ